MALESSGPVDLLFVLAGAPSRKLYGIAEFEWGRARRLILSTARFELRKFRHLPISPRPDLIEMAAGIPPRERHCFVSYPANGPQVDWVKVGRFGTMSEIEGLRAWLVSHPEVRSVLVVSSAYHLPRVALCCRRLLPVSVKVSFEAAPGEEVSWLGRLRERAKAALYLVVLQFCTGNAALQGCFR